MNEILQKGQKDKLNYYICSNRNTMGKLSAQLAAERIKELLKTKGEVRIMFAAAPSQDEFLFYLTRDNQIDWSRIVGFHMDEYLGLPQNSDQLFRVYLQKSITDKVPMKKFHFINGDADPEKEERRYTNLLTQEPIDMVCLGIGENGHIAFNDPPVADFRDPKVVKKVELDQYSRQQQVNDGCFPAIEDVPTHALTVTIPPMVSASSMICTVPGLSKKEAVSKVLNEKIDRSCPATILREHSDAHLILDPEAFGGK